MSEQPVARLRTASGELRFGAQPWLMAIVNASPDSFSDGGGRRSVGEQLEEAHQAVLAGAQIIDVGGESGVTNRPPVAPAQEVARVVPLIERIVRELGVPASIDTYKPVVAAAAVAAGAAIVNDTSGLRDPKLAEVCAETGAGLVLMHTRAEPKQKLLDPTLDGRVVDDVREFLAQRVNLAISLGLSFEQLLLDPGPDFGKTPHQTVDVLRQLEQLRELGRPLLLAVSRKDFIGAITRTPPRDRLPGTLAAIGFGVDAGAHILRVHDVGAVAQYLQVRSALREHHRVDPDLRLAEGLRRDQGPSSAAPGQVSPDAER